MSKLVCLAFTLPILQGKTEDWKQFVRTMARDRLREYEESRRHAGITKESTFLQQTAHGDAVIMYIEAKSMPKALEEFGKSQRPFDVWFRERFQEIHGLDLTNPTRFSELGFEWGIKGFVVDR